MLHHMIVPLKGHCSTLNATEGLELEPHLQWSMRSSKDMAAYSCTRHPKGAALGAGGSQTLLHPLIKSCAQAHSSQTTC